MGPTERLPGTQPDSRDQIVCHVDMDCFYAACERLREPALRGEPLVVGMGYEPDESGGVVATASYEAREFGVDSAMAMNEALDRLPRKIDIAGTDHPVEEAGFYRPVDMEFYESVASDVKDILHEYADTVREVSIDEAYLDVTDRTDWDGVEEYGRDLKAEIEADVSVTASVGVAPSLSAAKVASDFDKPDGLVVVRPGEIADFLAPLDVEEVHGIGPVTAEKMREMGIETAGDLAEADPAVIEERFGERGRRVYRFARGDDQRPVEPRGKPKSFSRESAFRDATSDEVTQRERIQTLAEAVAERAQRRDVLYQTIGIKVVEPPFDVNTREQSLSGPVEDANLVEEVALELFEEFAGEPTRKLGVRVSKLSFADEQQPALDEWDSAEVDSGAEGSNPEKPESESDDESEDLTTNRGQQSLTDYE